VVGWYASIRIYAYLKHVEFGRIVATRRHEVTYANREELVMKLEGSEFLPKGNVVLP
jgi:hypothetical protein